MRSFKILSLATVSTLALAGLHAADANSAGFYLQEQSVSGLGNAFAGQVATPRDSSIVYFNPAGMTHLKGTHANTGVHFIAPDSEIKDTGSTVPFGTVGGSGGNPYSISPVPNLSMSHEVVEDQLWFGFAVSAPFGLGNEYNDGWFGRYDSTETTLHTLDFQPSLAWKINDKLSIGGGLNIQYASANLESIRPIAGPAEGTSTLNGEDTSIGYNFGLLYEPIEGTNLGAHYRSRINHDLAGRIDIQNTANLNATADLHLPDIFQIGIDQRVNDKLSLQAGATWFGWSNFEDITVVSPLGTSRTTQNYQNTWAFAVGAEYQLNDKWELRAGYQYDETPTTDEYRTSLTPDGDRNWFATGATYQYNEKISFDAAATYIDISEEKINLTRNGSNIVGDTDGRVIIFAMGLNYKF